MNEESEQVSRALHELADEAFRQVSRERDEARAEVERLQAEVERTKAALAQVRELVRNEGVGSVDTLRALIVEALDAEGAAL